MFRSAVVTLLLLLLLSTPSQAALVTYHVDLTATVAYEGQTPIGAPIDPASLDLSKGVSFRVDSSILSYEGYIAAPVYDLIAQVGPTIWDQNDPAPLGSANNVFLYNPVGSHFVRTVAPCTSYEPSPPWVCAPGVTPPERQLVLLGFRVQDGEITELFGSIGGDDFPWFDFFGTSFSSWAWIKSAYDDENPDRTQLDTVQGTVTIRKVSEPASWIVLALALMALVLASVEPQRRRRSVSGAPVLLWSRSDAEGA